MKPAKVPLVVGVAGIMGAGKSTVARVFEDLGARLVDADAMGKDMLKEAAVRDAVVSAFGDGVRDREGAIDTAALGRLAFANPENARKLDEITRDPLIAKIKARIEELRASSEVIVIDAALLPEWNAKAWLDVLIVVDSEVNRSVERLAAASRFDLPGIRSRMEHQFSRAKKTSCADIVLPNYGSLEDLRTRARAIFRTIRNMETSGA